MKSTLSVIAVLLAVGAAPALAQSRPAPPPHAGPEHSCQSPKDKNSAACKAQPHKQAGAGKAQPGPAKAQPAPQRAAPGKSQPPKVEPIRVRIGDKVDTRFKRHVTKSPKLERGYDYYELGDKLFRVDPTTQKILAVVGLIEAFSR